MRNGVAPIAVPVRFAGVDVLVQAVPVVVAGSEDTGIADRLVDAYVHAEAAIVAVASAVAGTVGRLAKPPVAPKQVTVAFGVSLSVGGDVVLVKGEAEATLAITLTYDTSS